MVTFDQVVSGESTNRVSPFLAMQLLDLPTEIKELIYIYADSIFLKNSCTTFRIVARKPIVIARQLLLHYSIGKADVANDQWINMVQDRLFDAEVAKALIRLRYKSKELIEIMLEYCTTKGDHELLQWILEHCIGEDQSSMQVIKNRTLVQASLFGHAEFVSYLINNGADVNTDSNSAICMAAKYGHLSVGKLLIAAGCNIHVDDEYPLCWASRVGNLDFVKLLVESGAAVNARRTCALHWAAEQGHERVVEYLLQNEADVHSNDDHALRWSTVHGHLHIVSLLIKYGADVHANNDYALRNAVKMNHLKIVEHLLQNGANPRAENEEAIQWAITHQNQPLLTMLQQYLSEE